MGAGRLRRCERRQNRRALPADSAVRLRQAKTLAYNIHASVRGQPLTSFHFDWLGALCVVGHHTACAELVVPFSGGKTLRFSGLLAWLMWRAIYLAKLPGLERKVRVLVDWVIALFPRDIVQTIDVGVNEVRYTMRAPVTQAVIICTIVGLLGGMICLALGLATLLTGVVLGGLYGAIFALLGAPRAATPGAGLLWGLGYALLLWLAVPAGVLPLFGAAHAMGMLDTARAHFPELLAYVLCFGLPLGLTLGTWGSLRLQPDRARFSLPRALIERALVGVVGGWAFGRWMEQINFFLIIAGLVHSTSLCQVWRRAAFRDRDCDPDGSFGLLFQRDVRGYGSSLGWGMAYGLFWWFLFAC